MLTIPSISADAAAAQLAQRLVGGAIQSSVQTAQLLDNGAAGQAATAPSTSPDGRLNPGNPGTPAVTPEALAASIGASNLLKLGVARLALLGDATDAQLTSAYAALTA